MKGIEFDREILVRMLELAVAYSFSESEYPPEISYSEDDEGRKPRKRYLREVRTQRKCLALSQELPASLPPLSETTSPAHDALVDGEIASQNVPLAFLFVRTH